LARADQEADQLITQEVFDQFPNGLQHDHQQFQGYDNNFAQQFNQQQFPSPPHPPTPPNQIAGQAQQSSQQHQIQQAQQRVQLQAAQSVNLQDATKEEADDRARQGSNSDDDDLTPAQSRRKAQNRAA
jgi:AP-1-like transcription factor